MTEVPAEVVCILPPSRYAWSVAALGPGRLVLVNPDHEPLLCSRVGDRWILHKATYEGPRRSE